MYEYIVDIRKSRKDITRRQLATATHLIIIIIIACELINILILAKLIVRVLVG